MPTTALLALAYCQKTDFVWNYCKRASVEMHRSNINHTHHMFVDYIGVSYLLGCQEPSQREWRDGFRPVLHIHTHTPLSPTLISILFHLPYFNSVATKNFLRQKNIGEGAFVPPALKLRQCIPTYGIRSNAGGDSGRRFWSSMTECTLYICMTINMCEKKVIFISFAHITSYYLCFNFSYINVPVSLGPV